MAILLGVLSFLEDLTLKVFHQLEYVCCR